MRRTPWIPAVLLLVGGLHLGAQQATPALPQYTDAQRWGRLAGLSVAQVVAEIELGKSRGMSIGEIGEWLGSYWAATWAGGLDARSLATSFRWNWLSDPRQQVEMPTFTDSLVVMRGNYPALNDFGPDRKYRSVTFDEFKQTNDRVSLMIADQVGVKLEIRYEGNSVVLTFRNKYEPPRASDAVRWGRAAAIIRYATLDVIRTGKAAGRSPRELGLASAKAWEGTWTGADTPYRLFRGFAWNNFTDPDYVCEVLAASPTQVQARCNRPWSATVTAEAQRTGVSVDDYEAYQLGIEQGIAASLGMTWEVVVAAEGAMRRTITVRKN